MKTWKLKKLAMKLAIKYGEKNKIPYNLNETIDIAERFYNFLNTSNT